MKHPARFVVSALASVPLFLLLALLMGCAGAEEPPTPTTAEFGPVAGVTAMPTTAEIGTLAGATATVPVETPVPACAPENGLVEHADGGPGYPPGQVVITGLKDEVTSVTMDLDPSGDAWEQVRDIPLPDNPKQISLYCITDGTDALDAADAFNLSARDLFDDDPPLAEPNYFIQPPNGLDGYPNGGSAAIGGAPASPPYILPNASNVARAEFLAQWALAASPPGISLPHPSLSGSGVRVAIFDTSPYIASGEVSYVGGSLGVTALVDELGTYAFEHNPERGDEHGLFVASLIQAVAPASELQLLQILDGELRGSLFSLIHALDLYHSEFVPSTASATPIVVNLSLGFEAEAVNTRERPVASLRALLESYERLGYIFVAAAGNAGRDITFQPASYPSVLAVAASTSAGERACFSNVGQVAAPGGGRSLDVTAAEPFPLAAFREQQNGEQWVGVTHDSAADLVEADCYAALDTWCSADVVGCGFDAITGNTTQRDDDSGYAYWAGTSFATPLVSGLAALLVDLHWEKVRLAWAGQNLGCSALEAFPQIVRNLIIGSTATANPSNSEPAFGAGIINVEAALATDPVLICP